MTTLLARRKPASEATHDDVTLAVRLAVAEMLITRYDSVTMYSSGSQTRSRRKNMEGKGLRPLNFGNPSGVTLLEVAQFVQSLVGALGSRLPAAAAGPGRTLQRRYPPHRRTAALIAELSVPGHRLF